MLRTMTSELRTLVILLSTVWRAVAGLRFSVTCQSLHAMKRTREDDVVQPLPEPQSAPPPQQQVGAEEHDSQPLGTALPFSPDFIAYLSGLNIDPMLLALAARQLPRYIRLNPRITQAPTIDSLAAQLNAQLHPTAVPSVYRLASTAPVALAASTPYKRGLVYGIDLASVLAVRALSLPTSPPSALPATECVHVLDLCCAPGAKLAYMHDLLSTEWSGPFTLTGVDVSLPRLSSCRNLLHKYQCRNTTLCLADGRTFRQPPPAPTTPHSAHQPSATSPSHYVIHDLTAATDGPNKLLLTKRQKRARRRQQTTSALPLPPPLQTEPQRAPTPFSFATSGYHHILVDAQCSHDGSVRHLVKQAAHTAPPSVAQPQ